eukprot:3350830-Ditylum_brightwellii.AAC.2
MMVCTTKACTGCSIGASAFGAGCQEGSKNRSVAGDSVERWLGIMWVPKSDRRMIASGETWLELDWG